MASARRTHHFSIIQGMALTAAFAVSFALAEIIVALELSCLIALLVLLWQYPHQKPSALGDSTGCLACFIGFAVGALIGGNSQLQRGFIGAIGSVAECGLSIFPTILFYGALGAIIAGSVAHFVGRGLIQRRLESKVEVVPADDALQEEMQVTERLVTLAQEADDIEVYEMLTNYYNKLLDAEWNGDAARKI